MSVRLRRGTVVVLEPRPRRAGGRLTAAVDSLDAVGVAIMVADADTAEAAQAGRSPCSPDVTGQPNDGQTSARTDAPIGFPACRAVEVTRRARFSAAGGLRRAKCTAGLALVALLLIGCGGGEAPRLPSGTLSRSAGALPSLPSLTATLPGPTRSPTRPDTAAETAQPANPTRSVTRPAPPTQAITTTEVPDPATTGPAAAAPASPETSSPSAAGPTAETSETTAGLWWLLAAVLVAVAVAVPLLRRARRRRTWQADLATAEDEVAWFAHSLVPDLRRAASLDQAAGGWAVGSSRVSALEDRLTALEATAPDDADRGRARTLRDAVRASRNRLGGLIAAGDADALLRDLDAVAAELDTALASHA